MMGLIVYLFPLTDPLKIMKTKRINVTIDAEVSPALEDGKPVDYRMTVNVGWAGAEKNMGK